MNKVLAFDFLLFSTMGTTSSDSKEEVVDAAIKTAYSDASRHVGYGNPNATKVLKDAILEPELDAGFVSWHNSVCKRILPSEKEAGYGKTQKWLNMTMKYLAVAYAVISEISKGENEFIEFYEKIWMSNEKCFRIPIDGNILDALAWSDTGSTLSNKMPHKEDGKPKKDLSDCNSPREYIKNWSTWTDSDYTDFAKQLDEDSRNSLDWETKAWIEVAKYRAELDSSDERPKLQSEIRKFFTSSPKGE